MCGPMHGYHNTIDPGSNLRFAELFFLPFQIRNHVGKAYIFNNNEGKFLKVELKVSGRVRVGVGRDLFSQYPCNHLNS